MRNFLFAKGLLGNGAPFVYAAGIYLLAVAYGLYYVVSHRRYDPRWVYGIIFCFFYLAFMLWQTYWAIATARSSSWGTRPSTAGKQQPALEPSA